jgi:hypothetical protein
VADARPTEAEVVNYVFTRGVGVAAVEVMRHFVSEGYPARDVQRSIQRALDRGALELGDKLRLTAARQLAAA